MTKNLLSTPLQFVLWALCSLSISSSLARDEGGPFARMIEHKDGSRTVTAFYRGMDKQMVTTIDKDGNEMLTRINYLDERTGRPKSFDYYKGGPSEGMGALLLRGAFTYDSRGNMVEETLYTPTNQPVRRLTKQYNAAGMEIDQQVKEYQALPAEILRWSDPDAAASDDPGQAANESRGQDRRDKPKGFLRKLFGGKNNR